MPTPRTVVISRWSTRSSRDGDKRPWRPLSPMWTGRSVQVRQLSLRAARRSAARRSAGTRTRQPGTRGGARRSAVRLRASSSSVSGLRRSSSSADNRTQVSAHANTVETVVGPRTSRPSASLSFGGWRWTVGRRAADSGVALTARGARAVVDPVGGEGTGAACSGPLHLADAVEVGHRDRPCWIWPPPSLPGRSRTPASTSTLTVAPQTTPYATCRRSTNFCLTAAISPLTVLA